MERPKLRLIEALPFVEDGRELILLRDAEGIVKSALAVSREMAFMISLMDGTRTLRDIQHDFMRAFGEMVYMERIEELVGLMDENLMLQGERYEAYAKKVRDEYNRSPVRAAYLAGQSYSSNPIELLAFLDEMFTSDGDKVVLQGEVAGILAPHIDYQRGIDVYRPVYRFLKYAAKTLIVVFGTCHRPTKGLWSISLKDFATPLETIPCGQGLRELIRDNDFLKGYIEEWPHRVEHSIELQLPLIQFNVQEDFEILPILTGSMHEYIEGTKNLDDKEIKLLVSSLKEVLNAYGRPYCVISGADLAHIGAQFGDQYPLDSPTLEGSKEKDTALLKHIKNVDGEGFFRAVQDERDSRRICGLAPVFFQLKLLEGCRADITGYEQWTDGTSSVSFAGGIFYR